VQPLSDVVAMQLGIRGVIIGQVMLGGPASQAGMQGTVRTRRGRWRLGDVIVGLDQKKINRYHDFYDFFKTVKPGQIIQVTFMRGNKKHQAKVKSVALTLQSNKRSR
jgi:S1-C subfamily serine protease